MESDFKRDPWVKVGTTTIDGLISHVVERIGGDENDLMGWRTPRLVGGQMLVGHEFGATQDGMVVMRCDIVRRQSEIDAEKCKRLCAHCETPSDTQFCESCVVGFRAMDPPCPECGPHGNRGEVLLASSWAKCTTCAGGKPGDLWGEVKAEGASPTHAALSSALIAKGASSEVAQAGVRQFIDALNKPTTSFMDARREALLVQLGQGFKVPTLAECAAELDNLWRYLKRPEQADDGTSIGDET